MSTQASPVASWETTSAQWVIPQHIVDQAPESPCVHRLANFALGLGDTAQTASQQCACQLLVESGTALDAGCGGGQSSVPLVRAATSITGVDDRRACCRALGWRGKMLVLPTAKYSVVGRLSRHTSCQPMLPCAITWSTTWPTSSHSSANSPRTPAVASWSSYRRSTQRHRWQRCGNTSGDLHGRWSRRWTLAPRRQVARLRAAMRSDRAAPEQAVYCPSGSQRRKADDRYGDLGIHYSLTTTH